MQQPLVTVILATYNGARYLPEQLESLAKQRHRPAKLVLRDDGSDDGSVDIVKDWGVASGIDVRHVEADDRLGPALSFLTALREAGAADVYLFCDQDDFWLPNKIAYAVEALSAGSPDIPHLYATRLQIADEQLRSLRLSPVPHGLSFASAACESVLTGCSMAFNPALARLLMGELPRFLVMHDWWCYLLASGAGKVSFDARPSLLYRQHTHNTLGAGPRGLRKLQARLSTFLGPKSTQRSRQLQELERLHGEILAPDARKLLAQLIAKEQSPIARVLTAFTSPIQRQTRLSVLSTRISLLTHRF